MADSDESSTPPEQERIRELLLKIVAYQRSLPDGRAVELDELKREGVLEAADIEFLTVNSVTYKPHGVSDYHALDMFHMPIADGSCVFIGPSGPPLKKRRMPLQNFQAVVENFLKLARPRNELLLHIELSKKDGMGVSPEMVCFTFRSMEWRERLPAIRRVAAEFGLKPLQDEVRQVSHVLTFKTNADSKRIAATTVALLSRGCGFGEQMEITYLAGALDEG